MLVHHGKSMLRTRQPHTINRLSQLGLYVRACNRCRMERRRKKRRYRFHPLFLSPVRASWYRGEIFPPHGDRSFFLSVWKRRANNSLFRNLLSTHVFVSSPTPQSSHELSTLNHHLLSFKTLLWRYTLFFAFSVNIYTRTLTVRECSFSCHSDRFLLRLHAWEVFVYHVKHFALIWTSTLLKQ